MYTAFFTTSLFTTSLNFFKSSGIVFHLSTSKLPNFLKTLFKPVGTLTNLLMFRLSTSAFKARKSLLAPKLDVSTPVAFLIIFNSLI